MVAQLRTTHASSVIQREGGREKGQVTSVPADFPKWDRNLKWKASIKVKETKIVTLKVIPVMKSQTIREKV